MEELRLQEELKKTRQELLLLYEIGNLIRTTLLLDEVIYLILSAVTSHDDRGRAACASRSMRNPSSVGFSELIK